MILDTSAIVAVLLRESEAESILRKMLDARALGVGTPTLAEAAIVLSARMGADARPLLSRFLLEASIQTVPFGDAHFAAAVDAWLRFGKGRHPAALNFGDCLSYAVARLSHEPLLATGGDFAKTDVLVA